jgi:hypothetical protein
MVRQLIHCILNMSLRSPATMYAARPRSHIPRAGTGRVLDGVTAAGVAMMKPTLFFYD